MRNAFIYATMYGSAACSSVLLDHSLEGHYPLGIILAVLFILLFVSAVVLREGEK